ncbi:MAG: transcriptional regulator [Alphaproteobacteria bacterium]|nr:transcriptional regulator [Alphaproteobacteria bacterium]
MAISKEQRKWSDGLVTAMEIALRLVKKRTPEALSARSWLETFRSALGMSVNDLAARAGVSRSAVYQMQAAEENGSVTLATLDKMAAAMGGRLVYAIVPSAAPSIPAIIQKQALQKAREIVTNSRTHMALEDQSDGLSPVDERIKEVAEELARTIPKGFWS